MTDMWLSNTAGPQPTWIQYEFDKVYKLHEMWVWNSNQINETTFGLGAKDVTIEYSTDGVNWMILDDVVLNQATGLDTYTANTTVDLKGAAAKTVKVTIISNWGGILPQYSLSEVRFFYIPTYAQEPKPDSGATGVDPSTSIVLGWRAGRDAASHGVYLSSDEQAVIDGNAPVTTVTEASYSPLSLELGETYYWKVNEVNMTETTTTWQSEIWNFTTLEFFVVDDFEDYNDYQPDEIWRTWPDGYGVPANGATVGYPDPVDFLAGEHYVETTIVHGGKQAMPFFYDNTGTAEYSEGKRTFAVPQNWTKAGVQTLVLYFHGTIGNTGQLYVKVNDKKVVYDPGPIVTPPGWLTWKQWNIDLASVGTDLSSVNTLAIGVDGAWATGMMYIDDILLYKSAPPVPKVLTWFEAESGTITSPMHIYAGDITASGEQYIGTDEELGDETGAPPEDGIATYSFSVPGGVYKLVLRIVATSGSNTFWVRIPNATTNTTNHPTSGWVLFDQQLSDDWQWTEVTSRNDGNQVVEFTLPAGTHTLEVARREDGTLLDAIAIVSLTD